MRFWLSREMTKDCFTMFAMMYVAVECTSAIKSKLQETQPAAWFFQPNLKQIMSAAFVKESEEQWLHDVLPTFNALVIYLTKENNGVLVYERSSYVDNRLGQTVHVMSNSGSYTKDDGRWKML